MTGPGARRDARRGGARAATATVLAALVASMLLVPTAAAGVPFTTRPPCSDGIGNVKDQVGKTIIDELIPDWIDHPWGPESPGDLWKRCAEPFLPPPGRTTADPHVTTVDGLLYDLQAAGDVVLLETDDGRVSVQARYVRRDDPSVSYVDGIAIGLPGATVVVDRILGLEPPVVTIDGIPVDLGPLGWRAFDGGVVHQRGRDVTVLLDGDGAVRTRYATAEVVPARPWLGSLAGTLGDADGDPADDLVRRDGTAIDPRDPDALYGPWLDDWLVAPGDSLFPTPFDEAEGPTRPVQRLTLADLPPAEVARAAAVCAAAGLVSGAGLEACTFDVARTGDEVWAEEARAIDRPRPLVPAAALGAVVDARAELDVGDRVSPDEPVAGAGRLADRAEVDEFVVVDGDGDRWLVPTAPCSAPLSAVALVEVEGAVVATLPLLCGRAHRLPEGLVTLRVTAPSGAVGTYGFRVSDVDEAAVGATSVAASVGSPVDLVVAEVGQVATADLELQAGQRVYVETVSSLPSVLTLVGPGGAELARWAPFLESGVVEAPAGGPHRLRVEPAGEAVGTITLLVHEVADDLRSTAEPGDVVSLDITTPGQVAVVELELAAGERIVVETLDQIVGEYTFASPDGTVLATWRQFLDPDELVAATAGTHTITFDPQGATTGVLRFSVAPG